MIDGVAVVAPAAYATASIRNECAPAFLCSNLSTAYLNNVSRALRIFFGLFLPVVLMLSRTGIGRNSETAFSSIGGTRVRPREATG